MTTWDDTLGIRVLMRDNDHAEIILTTTQLHLLQTICDVTRDDDDPTNPCIPFADALYAEINAELDATKGNAA